jgi:heavy metal translocating P-type ATPase
MSCCSLDTATPGKPRQTKSTICGNLDLVLLIIAGFIAGNSTLFALVTNVAEMDAQTRSRFQLGLLASTLIVTSLLAPQLLKRIWTSRRTQSLSVDILFAMGCVGAMAFSLIAYWTGEGPVYFEVVSVLAVVYSLGTWVKGATQRKILSNLGALFPSLHQCRVITGQGKIELRAVDTIREGELVQVPASGMIPIDGFVREGKAFVQESTITGEPHLRSVAAGDLVFASSLLLDESITVEATSDGGNRLVDRIVSTIELSQRSPSVWQTQADRVATVFTPTVASLALITFVVWSFRQDPFTALLTALSVLLVACPCAFGFATPISIWVTLSRLAASGLIVRRNDAIERLASINCVVFDKTGTLTVIEPKLSWVDVRVPETWPRERVLQFAQSIEAQSHHPIASAFIDANSRLLPVRSLRSLPGVGVQGTVEFEGLTYLVEVGRLAELQRPCCDAKWLATIEGNQSGSQQQLAIRIDSQLVAVAHVEEVAIETLAEGLEGLKEKHIDVQLLTGDRGDRVDRIGVRENHQAMTPDEKASHVSQLVDSGWRVLFVGDGVNDAAAMSRATLAISVAGGAGIATEIADIEWQGHDLRAIGNALTIAQRSVSRLRRTLIFAVTYNTVGMTIAASGYLHPVIAVLLMMGSSLTVVLYASDLNWEAEHASKPLPLSQNVLKPNQFVTDSDAKRSRIQLPLLQLPS